MRAFNVFKNEENGIIFAARLVRTGANYGLNQCLKNSGENMIEFYDCRYPHTPLGQFVSRYYVSTFMELKHTGLCLYGGVEDWYITAHNVVVIQNLLKGMPL